MELIQTKDYLLFISNKIELKKFFYCEYSGNINEYSGFEKDECCKTILGYYPLTKESKELEGIPLLPNPFEKDIEKLAKEKISITI